MLVIRLQRIGKKNKPSYRVVISDKKKDLYGKHNEILGSYDPTSSPKKIVMKADRIKYWISVGAKPSPTVHNLLISQNIIEGKKIKAWHPKKKKGAVVAPQAKKEEKVAEIKPEEPKQETTPEPIKATEEPIAESK